MRPRWNLGSLLLVGAASAGCDPVTLSRISNDTTATISIELTLDKDQWRHGFEPAEYEQWLSERTDAWVEEELRAYSAGSEGVELVSMDADRIAGSYQVAPKASLIVSDTMGTGALSLLLRDRRGAGRRKQDLLRCGDDRRPVRAGGGQPLGDPDFGVVLTFALSFSIDLARGNRLREARLVGRTAAILVGGIGMMELAP